MLVCHGTGSMSTPRQYVQKETRVAQLEVFTIIGTTVKIYTLNK